MTPQTRIIDRNFKGVGRIKKATGSTLPKMRRKLSDMLTAMHESGRLDVLRAIRDGQLSMLTVYEAYQRRALDTLPLAGTLLPLGEAMRKWIDSADVSPKHAVSLGQSLKYLLAWKPDAKVNDLPTVLESLRNTLGITHPRSFNLARHAASKFVAATLKRSHPLYGAVRDIEGRKAKPKKKRTPLSPEQMRGFFPSPATNDVDAIAWGMALSGMGESEYWGKWELQADRIHIEGTKRKARVRDVPLVQPIAVPRIHPRTFTNKLRERTNRRIVPYDLRRTYANWLESAGISRTRRKLYMGHSAGDVTGLYELHEVTAFLVEDSQKLRDFLNVTTKAHTMALHKVGT